MKWIKANERLPELPNPLPPDTEDERGILFVNRKHASAYFWFPSYGQSSVPYTTEDGHWSLDQYEWLDESQSGEGDAVDVSVVRQALADYISSEGCRCCQNVEEHEKAKAKLGELLHVKKYEDGSGYNFYSYTSKEKS